MKKVYKSPASLTVMLGTINIVASSPFSFSDDNNSGSGGIYEDYDAEEESLVKSSSVWDNEWN